MSFFIFMHTENATADGKATEVEIEHIHVEDSSPKPPAKNKKPKITRADTRKIVPSQKMDPTSETQKDKKDTLDKGERKTKTARKLVCNESANSSPYADVLKVSLIYFVLSISNYFRKY